jgi:hypothetical protein
MQTSSSSPRYALRVLLKVNDTLEQVLAERMRAQHVIQSAEPGTATTPIAADACSKCGHTIENGQLVTSDFTRHISCPEIPAHRSAA